MSFDLTGPFGKIDWSAESQMVEGGRNEFNNCVPTAFQTCLLSLGYADVEPQTWTDTEYGASFTGGEDFAHAIDFTHKHFPGVPEIRVSNPRDTLAAVDAAGKAGFPMVLQCHCDRDAAFVDHYTGFFHMGIPVAWDGTNLTIRNVYWGKLHVLPASFAKAMTWDPAGWMAIFARTIVAPVSSPAIDPCADVKTSLARTVDQLNAQTALVGKQQAELTAWATWAGNMPK